MDRHLAVVMVVAVLGLAPGCASRALSDAEAMSVDALGSWSTRVLLRVAAACDRPGPGLAEFYRCEGVYSELVDRHEHRDRRQSRFGGAWVEEQSCADVVAAVDAAEQLGAGLSIGYAGVGQEGRMGALVHITLAHAERLFWCGDAEALERYLEAIDAMGTGEPNYHENAAAVAEWLGTLDAEQMAHLQATAPPGGRLARAVRRSQRASSGCPVDESGAIAAMRDHDPMRRAMGCSCVNTLPEDARAEAMRTRDQVIDSDPYVETAGTRSPDRRATGRGLAELPGALVDIATLPLTAIPGERYYPIRLYCEEKRAADAGG
ncbi:MAG: hypothetical protein K0V04_29460 [Deltaproteobacteria bacterium]|nr:hypothetical protein [Deltaproteobacteria bacterium]